MCAQICWKRDADITFEALPCVKGVEQKGSPQRQRRRSSLPLRLNVAGMIYIKDSAALSTVALHPKPQLPKLVHVFTAGGMSSAVSNKFETTSCEQGYPEFCLGTKVINKSEASLRKSLGRSLGWQEPETSLESMSCGLPPSLETL